MATSWIWTKKIDINAFYMMMGYFKNWGFLYNVFCDFWHSNNQCERVGIEWFNYKNKILFLDLVCKETKGWDDRVCPKEQER